LAKFVVHRVQEVHGCVPVTILDLSKKNNFWWKSSLHSFCSEATFNIIFLYQLEGDTIPRSVFWLVTLFWELWYVVIILWIIVTLVWLIVHLFFKSAQTVLTIWCQIIFCFVCFWWWHWCLNSGFHTC
jgi:hypothetical protein